MRISRLVLPLAAALALAAPASAVSPAYTGYVWSQPGTALQANPFAQMPRWLVTAKPLTVAQLPILRTYRWAQPGSAPVQVPYGQPWSL